MSKQCSGVPSQNPRLRSPGTSKSVKGNEKEGDEEGNYRISHKDLILPRRRHSSPSTQHKKQTGNNPSRGSPYHHKDHFTNYKKNRCTSAGRAQQYGVESGNATKRDNGLEESWWNEQIRLGGGSDRGPTQRDRGRSRKPERLSNPLNEGRQKDDRGNAFQVILLKYAEIGFFTLKN